MAYSANGHSFPSKSLSRVKYDLIVDGDNRYYKGKAPELIKIQLTSGATNIFFNSAADYIPVPFDPSALSYSYGDQIFLDVAGEKNLIWINEALVGTCLDTVNAFINNPA